MDFTKEIEPGSVFNPVELGSNYWNNSGRIYFRHYPVKGADAESFRFYPGAFAKDKKHCYCCDRRLKGANPLTFRALNYTYFKDDKSVWSLGGKVKDADSETFTVCDEGYLMLTSSLIPHSFGKDKKKVFYYDFDGITNWVRQANPETFVSLGDGYFGKDDDFVFFGRAVIPKAKVQSWRKIGGFYSKDDSRIFYMNRLIKIADFDSFEFTETQIVQLAKDRNHYYWNENVISKDKYDELFR